MFEMMLLGGAIAPHTWSWSTLEPIPVTGIFDQTMFEYKGHLYSVGGQFSGGTVAPVNGPVWKYSIADNTWVELTTPMPNRFRFSACLVNDTVYFISGFFQNVKASVWSWNIDTDTWTQLPNAPVLFYETKCVAFGTYIYAFGGTVNTTRQTWSYAYNTLTGVWSTTNAMPVARASGGVVADTVNDAIYYIGGTGNPTADHNGVATVLRYTPSNGSWVTDAPLPNIAYMCGTCYNNGVAYLFGGISGGTYLDKLHKLTNGGWPEINTGNPKPPAAAFIGTVLADDKVFVLGGNAISGKFNDLWCCTPK